MTRTVRLAIGSPRFPAAAELFDEYRQHYGANPAPEAVGRWMRELMSHEAMRIYVAGPADSVSVDGMCSVSVVPASLTLRTAWLLRDLYVTQHARRGGVAKAMIAHIADTARTEGAHRLSLQTEPDNTRAIELYAQAGFNPVTDVILLHRLL